MNHRENIRGGDWVKVFKDLKNIMNQVTGTTHKPQAYSQNGQRCENRLDTDTRAPLRTEPVRLLYHRSLIKEREMKSAYDRILSGLESWNGSINLGNVQRDLVSDIFYAVLEDNPQLFHVDKKFTLQYTASNTTLKPSYNVDSRSAAVIQSQLDAIVNKLRKQMTGNRFEDERIIHDYVASTTKYAHSNKGDPRYHRLSGALLENLAVCEGISYGTAYLMDELGIPCCVISGNLRSSTESHAWNLVRLSGNYYHVDVTNDISDDGPQYVYLNLSDRQLMQTHQWNVHTECTDESRRYLGENGCVVDDLDEVKTLLIRRLREGNMETSLYFPSEHGYTIDDVMKVAGKVMGSAGRGGSYEVSMRGKVFTVTFRMC